MELGGEARDIMVVVRMSALGLKFPGWMDGRRRYWEKGKADMVAACAGCVGSCSRRRLESVERRGGAGGYVECLTEGVGLWDVC